MVWVLKVPTLIIDQKVQPASSILKEKSVLYRVKFTFFYYCLTGRKNNSLGNDFPIVPQRIQVADWKYKLQGNQEAYLLRLTKVQMTNITSITFYSACTHTNTDTHKTHKHPHIHTQLHHQHTHKHIQACRFIFLLRIFTNVYC
jgi:hypothetical protein